MLIFPIIQRLRVVVSTISKRPYTQYLNWKFNKKHILGSNPQLNGNIIKLGTQYARYIHYRPVGAEK